MVKVIYEDHKDGTSSLCIQIRRAEDGAVTETRWERQDSEVVMRNAHSNLQQFRNSIDAQKESYQDLESRIPKMQDSMERIATQVLPNLEDAISQLEGIVPKDYDPMKK